MVDRGGLATILVCWPGIIFSRFNCGNTAGDWCVHKNERTFGFAVPDMVGRRQRDADRIAASHPDGLVVDDCCVALHEDVGLLVIAV